MADPFAPPTPDPAPTADDRIARLEARVAELERLVTPPQTPGLVPTPGGGVRIVLPQELLAAQMAEYRSRVASVGPPPTAQAVRQAQLDAGADPTVPWARMEIERMREE